MPASSGVLSVKMPPGGGIFTDRDPRGSGCFPAPMKPQRGPPETPKTYGMHTIIAYSSNATQTNPQNMQPSPITQTRFLRKSPYVFENEGERGRGVTCGKGGCHVGSVPTSNANPKIELRLRTVRAPTTTAAPRLHRSSPNFRHG